MSTAASSRRFPVIQIAGHRHQSEKTECEDVIFIKETEDIVFLGLADGQSGKKHCVKGGARILQEVFNFFLSHEYSMIVDSYLDETQFILTRQIRNVLQTLSKEHNAPTTEFSSTLVIMVMNKKNNRYISVHVGDGTIAGLTHEGDLKIISMPENGITNRYTWLTTSPDVLLHLRINFGSLSNYKAIYLLSDGAQALMMSQNELKSGDDAAIERRLELIKPCDDATCIIYYCDEHNGHSLLRNR